jgi:rubrerythrin
MVLREFETMKSFELSACDLYTRIASDARVTSQEIREAFARLAEDERRHAGLVQEIIDLIRKALP